MKETHLRLGLEQLDLKLGKKKWLDPNLITCVVLKMRRIGVSRNPIGNLQMKREKRLRRAKILEAMKQTEVSVLLLGKITRNFHCSFLLLLYMFSHFWVIPLPREERKLLLFFTLFQKWQWKLQCGSSKSSLFIILILTAIIKYSNFFWNLLICVTHNN